MGDNDFPSGKVSCDGRCGPSYGPNCPACIMYGCSKGEQYPLVRGASVQGDTGLFYCGRKFCRPAGTHDGRCGPNKGPNCRFCRSLTHPPNHQAVRGPKGGHPLDQDPPRGPLCCLDARVFFAALCCRRPAGERAKVR